MGQGVSKTEQIEGEMKGIPPRIQHAEPSQPPFCGKTSSSDSKRRAVLVTRTSSRRDDSFGLDENQSRSTESTQGSPEIDMYPSKTPKGNRSRTSFGATGSRWFHRRPSTNTAAMGATHKESLKNDPLPPSYLVFKQPEIRHRSLPVLQTNGKTAPVPVKRKGLSTKRMDRWEAHSDGDVTDLESRVDELERMYDMRTWDMYLRITEARKNKPVPTMIPHHQPPPPPQQQPMMHHHHLPMHTTSKEDYDYFTPGDGFFMETDLSRSEEMIFGDLE